MAKNQYEGLTEQQIQFADYYLELNNATQSAIKAGYAPNSAYTQASRLLKNVKIQAYMQEIRDERERRVREQLAKYAEKAIVMLYDLAQNATSEAVRNAAIKDILDRSGYKPTDKIDSKTDHSGRIEFGFVDPSSDD